MIMSNRKKQPRTYHLNFSQSVHSDDKVIDTLDHLIGRETVISTKMDGESTSIYRDGLHARSLDSAHNFTRNFPKQFHAIMGHEIPVVNGVSWRFVFENCSYFHAIEYNDLDSFLYLLSVWDENNNCLSWDDTKEWAELFDVPMPKELYRGPFDLKIIKEIAKNIDTKTSEGFVVRATEGFAYADYDKFVAKWVRADHTQRLGKDGKPVESDEHWLKSTYPNKAKSVGFRPAYMANPSPNKNTNSNSNTNTGIANQKTKP